MGNAESVKMLKYLFMKVTDKKSFIAYCQFKGWSASQNAICNSTWNVVKEKKKRIQRELKKHSSRRSKNQPRTLNDSLIKSLISESLGQPSRAAHTLLHVETKEKIHKILTQLRVRRNYIEQSSISVP